MNNKVFISGKVTDEPYAALYFTAAEVNLYSNASSCNDKACCRNCVFYDPKYIIVPCRLNGLSKNIKVVNPLDLNLNGKPWLYCMFVCISKLLLCSTVFMLSNWQQSRGAKIEHRIATILRKNIIYQRELSTTTPPTQ